MGAKTLLDLLKVLSIPGVFNPKNHKNEYLIPAIFSDKDVIKTIEYNQQNNLLNNLLNEKNDLKDELAKRLNSTRKNFKEDFKNFLKSCGKEINETFELKKKQLKKEKKYCEREEEERLLELPNPLLSLFDSELFFLLIDIPESDDNDEKIDAEDFARFCESLKKEGYLNCANLVTFKKFTVLEKKHNIKIKKPLCDLFLKEVQLYV